MSELDYNQKSNICYQKSSGIEALLQKIDLLH